MNIPTEIKWLDKPAKHNFPAAADYLALLFPPDVVNHLLVKLHHADVIEKKAKDVMRASGLTILGTDNVHVAHNLEKIVEGKELSPCLFVVAGGKLIIADGYHRSCSVYHESEDAPVKCKIVYL